MTSPQNNKIIVVLGPTSSGKSDLAVSLAKKFNGEVISADSRQVYKGLDIGSGKITKEEMQGVQHYLLDVVDPETKFTVSDFKKLAEKAISEILEKGKVPIICGGTGFYIQAIVDNVVLPEVNPNEELRKELEGKSAEELLEILIKLDPARAENIDIKNPRRLIRAIEIAKNLGKVPDINKDFGKYEALQIGIETDQKELKERIYKRILTRVKSGMIEEVEKLHQEGLSWERLDELGLDYRYLARHLQGQITKEEMIEKIYYEDWHYAKRQMTWFNKDKRIKWFELKNKEGIEGEVEEFLKLT
ncbi:MAG: tRNA (adenosine(37)-N6)-dimethylallyltransferase MiaA [Candidatus Paceibacterota bacterium]